MSALLTIAFNRCCSQFPLRLQRESIPNFPSSHRRRVQ